LGFGLWADDEPPKVLEPGKESLDLPPALVATQRTTILRLLCPRPPGWRNQLHASPRQFCIQSVRFVGVVADETRRELPSFDCRADLEIGRQIAVFRD
jgi:hypothetical protein